MENILLVRSYYTEYNMLMGKIYDKLIEEDELFEKRMGEKKI